MGYSSDLKLRNSFLKVRVNNHKTKGDCWLKESPAKIVVPTVMGSNFITIENEKLAFCLKNIWFNYFIKTI